MRFFEVLVAVAVLVGFVIGAWYQTYRTGGIRHLADRNVRLQRQLRAALAERDDARRLRDSHGATADARAQYILDSTSGRLRLVTIDGR